MTDPFLFLGEPNFTFVTAEGRTDVVFPSFVINKFSNPSFFHIPSTPSQSSCCADILKGARTFEEEGFKDPSFPSLFVGKQFPPLYLKRKKNLFLD